MNHFIVIPLLLQYASARIQQGLPHQVFDVTQSTEAIVVASVTANDSIVEPATHTNTELLPTPISTPFVYTTLFPSPNASPVEITAQSQVVTSYIPEMIWCVGAPIVQVLITEPLYNNTTANSTTYYSASIDGTGSCSTMFAPIETTVCATTLTGLGSKIPVTDCDQQITFSTEYGFTLESATPVTSNGSLITPAPTVKRVQTYYLAPWQSLTAGEAPPDVDVKICTDLDDDDGRIECVRYQEVWEVVVVTSTVTTERTVQISTTVSGPGTLVVASSQAVYTDTIVSIDLSTVLLLETEIETESISSGRKPTATVKSTMEVTTTVFTTRHSQHASTRYGSV
jgi:hypothetical protein